MNYMMCRNRVRNFDQWKRVFDNRADAHRAAGLKLVHLWYELNSPRNVFFLFEVQDLERARAFLNGSDAIASERESGLIEGDVRLFSESLGYGPLDEAENHAFAEATRSVVAAEEANAPAAPEDPERSSVPEKSPVAEKGSVPEKSPVAEKGSVPEKSPVPEKGSVPEKSPTPSEPVKTAEPASNSTPPATMKGPERVKSAPPDEPFEGWKPVENWPPAEAAAEVVAPHEPPHHHRRWERIKY